MNIKRLDFEIEGISLFIEVEIDSMENVLIPIHKPTPGKIEGWTTITPIANFTKDIESLLPNSFKTDFFNETMDSLDRTIQNHLNKFGRLLPADLETFVGETILIMCAVSRALDMPVPRETEKPQLFAMLYERVMKAMPK